LPADLIYRHRDREQNAMDLSVKDNIYLQREQLARMLHEPLAQLAERCAPVWGDRQQLNAVLLDGFDSIPYCNYLYCVGTNGVQICDNVGQQGVAGEYFGRDRSQRPYMKEAVPIWGFLLSDAYINLSGHRPSLTALQVVHDGSRTLGYLGADFDLRNLPANSKLYEEPGNWRQIKGDPAIRGAVFQQCRIESPMDRNLEQALSILEELLTLRGVFQCQIHFSSSQATIWTIDDPFRYRILDHEVLCARPGHPATAANDGREPLPAHVLDQYLQRDDQPDLFLRRFALYALRRVPGQEHRVLVRERRLRQDRCRQPRCFSGWCPRSG
jgi:hypothetical protein